MKLRTLGIRDPGLVVLGLALSLLGLVFIFDAGYPRSIQAGRGSIPRECLMQCAFLIAAMVAAYFASRISSRTWFKGSKALWLVSLASIVAVAIPGIGYEMNGAARWLKAGPVLIQPSEFAKLAVVLYLAGIFAAMKPLKVSGAAKANWGAWIDHAAIPMAKRWIPGLWVAIAIALIAKEPDLGTAGILAFTAFVMLALGGVGWKGLTAVAAVGAVAIAVFIFDEPYRLERIANHVHRYEAGRLDDIGYQTVQSELAMASGGILGVGIGAGRAKHVLPAPTTDFVPTTIAEEFGYFGWLVVVVLLAGLVVRLYALAGRAPTLFGSLVLAGVATWIGIQSVTNLLMANGTLPAIGIPLPFVSSGGSSLVALWMALGACQSVLARRPQSKEVNVAPGSHGWRHGRPRLSRA